MTGLPGIHFGMLTHSQAMLLAREPRVDYRPIRKLTVPVFDSMEALQTIANSESPVSILKELEAAAQKEEAIRKDESALERLKADSGEQDSLYIHHRQSQLKEDRRRVEEVSLKGERALSVQVEHKTQVYARRLLEALVALPVYTLPNFIFNQVLEKLGYSSHLEAQPLPAFEPVTPEMLRAEQRESDDQLRIGIVRSDASLAETVEGLFKEPDTADTSRDTLRQNLLRAMEPVDEIAEEVLQNAKPDPDTQRRLRLEKTFALKYGRPQAHS